MLKMICVLYTFHQYINDVHLHGFPDQVLEDFVYHPLEGSPCVIKSAGYHLVAIDSPTNGEGCFVFIWWVHLDLIIIRISIHEAKELMSCRSLY